jgi:hypothetical protein
MYLIKDVCGTWCGIENCDLLAQLLTSTESRSPVSLRKAKRSDLKVKEAEHEGLKLSMIRSSSDILTLDSLFNLVLESTKSYRMTGIIPKLILDTCPSSIQVITRMSINRGDIEWRGRQNEAQWNGGDRIEVDREQYNRCPSFNSIIYLCLDWENGEGNLVEGKIRVMNCWQSKSDLDHRS